MTGNKPSLFFKNGLITGFVEMQEKLHRNALTGQGKAPFRLPPLPRRRESFTFVYFSVKEKMNKNSVSQSA
jgi:hypothetical protein